MIKNISNVNDMSIYAKLLKIKRLKNMLKTKRLAKGIINDRKDLLYAIFLWLCVLAIVFAPTILFVMGVKN